MDDYLSPLKPVHSQTPSRPMGDERDQRVPQRLWLRRPAAKERRAGERRRVERRGFERRAEERRTDDRRTGMRPSDDRRSDDRRFNDRRRDERRSGDRRLHGVSSKQAHRDAGERLGGSGSADSLRRGRGRRGLIDDYA